MKRSLLHLLTSSIDRDESDWKEAIEQDQMSWLQLIDQQEEVQKILGIQTIPRNYLLDDEGKVIGIDLPLEEVEKILKEELSL